MGFSQLNLGGKSLLIDFQHDNHHCLKLEKGNLMPNSLRINCTIFAEQRQKFTKQN